MGNASAYIIVGAQWGDEGKGKIVDALSEKAAIVARCQGGANAGHTVINEKGKFALHLVPSGIFRPEVECVIGPGVVVDPKTLLQEIEDLEKRGVDTSRLFVSERAHVVMPYHVLFDRLQEAGRGKEAIGTTSRGIGPTYTDKVARSGIRMGDLLDEISLRQRLETLVSRNNILLEKVYQEKPLDAEAIFNEYLDYGRRLGKRITAVEQKVSEALRRGQRVLLEGAQGTMLDVDHGTYPSVTSSNPTAAGLLTGLGIGPKEVAEVIGVFKAYSTRVGAGPLSTELQDDVGNTIRERGHEYGTTTGRPRRCGWFDAVAGRYSCQVNGFMSIALTRLDVLDGISPLKICTAYEVEGKRINYFPANIRLLEQAKPVFEELTGWKEPTEGITDFSQLPEQAQNYIRRIEELLDCKIGFISTGPERHQRIITKDFPF